jgi:hypothetical protein
VPPDTDGDATVGSAVCANGSGAVIAFGGYSDGDGSPGPGAVWVYELDVNAIEIGRVDATTIVRGIRIVSGTPTIAITFDDLSVQGS